MGVLIVVSTWLFFIVLQTIYHITRNKSNEEHIIPPVLDLICQSFFFTVITVFLLVMIFR